MAQIDWGLTGAMIAVIGGLLAGCYAAIYKLYMWAGARMNTMTDKQQQEARAIRDDFVTKDVCSEVQRMMMVKMDGLKETMESGFRNMERLIRDNGRD